ncbi:DUF3604 domain-containing protein [Aestuariirhabdus litorea]|uniref:DUF3604 domain-containing protein n=1 Tax=Aestuariirhabdus litorea TaxID=2528527 RepID=A0A3P3VNS0_9GAMM|nr:DUF3604 domain-containing protein [Aestuariirhabdus litorea]RRJ84402.1 DUF3604 domain-containing protein [Aestuariirhabdus litorea]RWW97626.1 DUF3604 domain-containing protein [Endozoicomonadaceae bacterium GTF-13]
MKKIALGLVTLAGLSAHPSLAAPTQLFWGDTHLHTSYSGDAYGMGNESADPDTAYRFAKGQPVIHPFNRVRVQLKRPLDFLVVADHAEYMGVMQLIEENSALLTDTETGQRLLQLMADKGGKGVYYDLAGTVVKGKPYPELLTSQVREPIWNRIIEAAESNNEPGKFTSFIGWEWSSMPGGANLHRIVFTNKGGEAARQFLPYSSMDSNRPEDFWSWLDKTSTATGADFVAITHNSNISNGLMFNDLDSDGHPISASYARTRMRWEPVAEITQVKGDSETHPSVSPKDPFADFETFDHVMTFGADQQTEVDQVSNFARSGLKRGLEIEAKTGANPFKFGMIGSTDSHTGLSTASEPNFWGKFGLDSIPENKDKETTPHADGWSMSAAGMVAVWAEQNTRESLFAAFKRKEVYATTGPRMQVRLFGGFDFTASDATANDLAEIGYRKGVPMGGDLVRAPKGKAPSFLIQAVKDPQGANLDRVQVVKGWLDKEGNSQEQVFNVALSDEREDRGADTQPVGNTVDLKTGYYSNSIGATELVTVWQDPSFDPDQRAFYYLRVLQIPTPRHTMLDAVALGRSQEELNYPAVIQERGYSSPIWYTP